MEKRLALWLAVLAALALAAPPVLPKAVPLPLYEYLDGITTGIDENLGSVSPCGRGASLSSKLVESSWKEIASAFSEESAERMSEGLDTLGRSLAGFANLLKACDVKKSAGVLKAAAEGLGGPAWQTADHARMVPARRPSVDVSPLMRDAAMFWEVGARYECGVALGQALAVVFGDPAS
eukprot:m51a1_g1998 hypothetical protein (179) ;mRNA; f:1215676-1216514